MKNHYVPQFIIKQFGKKINVFNMSTGEIFNKRRTENFFYENNKWPDEIETQMQKIESKASRILRYMSKGENVFLYINQEMELKRYFLMCSIRTFYPSEFVNKLKNYANMSDYILLCKEMHSNLKTINELKLSDYEIYIRALKIFTSCTTIEEICKHKLCTVEMYLWLLSYYWSYICIWDMPQHMEYFLSSTGLIIEYEGVWHMTGEGWSLSKKSYLLYKKESATNLDDRQFYNILLSICDITYENFSLFNISKSRSIVLVNPFFKLYNMENKKPDIWPAIIQNKHLFEAPLRSNIKKDKTHTISYKVKKINEEEGIYINYLILSQSPYLIGFNDLSKVALSIYFSHYFISNLLSHEKIGIPYNVVQEKFNQYFKNYPTKKLVDLCVSQNITKTIDCDKLMKKFLDWLLFDCKTNKYLMWHLSNAPDEFLKFPVNAEIYTWLVSLIIKLKNK